MKNVRILLGLLIVAKLLALMPSSHAAVMDQAARDMLTSTNEDENQDSVSRWGDSDQRKRKADPRASYVLAPIQESSFEAAGSGRAPASVRGPAAVDGVIVRSSDRKASPKTVARAAVSKKAVQEVSVIANDYGFFPTTVFVTQGIPVRMFITGASARSQCFMLDSFGVRRQIRSNKIEEVTFTPDQSGNFAFTCPMNGAKGVVVVKELEVGARVPASEGLSVSQSAVVQENPETRSVGSRPTSFPKESLIKDEDFGF